jgi:hypothetical protein
MMKRIKRLVAGGNPSRRVIAQDRLGLWLGLAVIAVMFAVSACTSEAAAIPGGSVGFGQVTSVADLASARGVLSDPATTWDEKNDTRQWIVNGEWDLNCPGVCSKANLQDIHYDMAFAMYRAEPEEIGKSSHGHTFWGFQATGVEILPGDDRQTLEIKGNITGSGEISTDGVTINLVRFNNGHFTMLVKMDDGNVLQSEVGGVVLESKGS